ncbi:MAG: hypothetical protein HOD92_16725 [Deltaproteobacteria bacterium]|jgi:hypothetical protein|nr:hypothetical protein [Deltaproteobacteria bacterium]
MATETIEASENNQTPEDKKQERYDLINRIIGKETFVDPLISEEITKAYSVYESDQGKILRAVVTSFQQYCRKCIREAALIEHKNDISQATTEEAETLKAEITELVFKKVKNDTELEQLLLMLIFKNTYWNWVRYGLKDIFTEQRTQPGHPINNYLNARFHKLKTEKGFKIIGDLVTADVTDIVNSFKNAVVAKKIKIFP